ncbi:5-deoxy-glucuronate isomerase [Microbacterium sp. gxy059]|uniref:5-deoxy-glucuronate isomerase n=1 Tax=Microbacterium sp. gxy059 TaxID=2957199 RepID=UPI003D9895F9
MSDHRIPAGETAHGAWQMDIAPERAGWAHSGIRSLALAPGASETFPTAGDEMILVPFEGGWRVEVHGEGTWDLAGRASVFSGPTDVLYVPRDAQVTVTSTTGGRLAIPTARAENRFPVQHVAASDVPVFVRGAGPWSRRIRDFGNASVIDADRLLAVEVVNPGGTWSGIPRHKHDVASETESPLEEIYFFEAAPTPGGGPGYGLMRVSSSEAGEIDVTEEVRSGDVVLVPFGWHGPVAAPPENHLYYLNVMAGPAGRSWNVTNHPEDEWVTEAWQGLAPDPRAEREDLPGER